MPTALNLTPAERASYLEAARRRPASSSVTRVEQSERARLVERVREAAAVLKARYAVRRVILVGSMAHEAWFAPDSDVDLAVEGLAARDYWQAWREVEEIIGDRPVDLLAMEMAGESLLSAIRRYGVEL